MKKLLLLGSLFAAVTAFAQTDAAGSDTPKTETTTPKKSKKMKKPMKHDGAAMKDGSMKDGAGMDSTAKPEAAPKGM